MNKRSQIVGGVIAVIIVVALVVVITVAGVRFVKGWNRDAFVTTVRVNLATGEFERELPMVEELFSEEQMEKYMAGHGRVIICEKYLGDAVNPETFRIREEDNVLTMAADDPRYHYLQDMRQEYMAFVRRCHQMHVGSWHFPLFVDITEGATVVRSRLSDALNDINILALLARGDTVNLYPTFLSGTYNKQGVAIQILPTARPGEVRDAMREAINWVMRSQDEKPKSEIAHTVFNVLAQRPPSNNGCVILVSDFQENSDSLSFVRNPELLEEQYWEANIARLKQGWQKLPELNGVCVRLYGVVRSDAMAPRVEKGMKFTAALFRSIGAGEVDERF